MQTKYYKLHLLCLEMWMVVVCQQLKKEGRRNAYELHKIQALHQRQKMVSHQDVASSMCFSVMLVELYLIK